MMPHTAHPNFRMYIWLLSSDFGLAMTFMHSMTTKFLSNFTSESTLLKSRWHFDTALSDSTFNREWFLSHETTYFGAVLFKNQRKVNKTCLSFGSSLIFSLQRNVLLVLCIQRHLKTLWFPEQSLIMSFLKKELTPHSLPLIFHQPRMWELIHYEYCNHRPWPW